LIACVCGYPRDAGGKHVGERRKIRHRRRLAAVKTALDGVTPAAGLEIDEVGHVAALVARINDLKASNLAPERTIAVSNIEHEITAKLEELNAAVEKRLKLEAQRQSAVSDLSRAHASFVNAIEPFVDNSVFDLIMRGEDVTAKSGNAITDLVEGGVSKLDQLLTINAAANLTAGLLAEAAHIGDPVLIKPIRERFGAETATIDRNLRQLPSGPETTALRERAQGLLNLGAGSDNIFDVRTRTLGIVSGDQRSLEANEKQLAALKTAQESLLVTLTPMIDDAAFNLVLTTEKVTTDSKKAIAELIDVGANVLEPLLTVRAEGNLAAGLLDQATSTDDVNLLEPLNERFVTTKEHIEKLLRELPPPLDDRQIQKAASTLLDLGKGN